MLVFFLIAAAVFYLLKLFVSLSVYLSPLLLLGLPLALQAGNDPPPLPPSDGCDDIASSRRVASLLSQLRISENERDALCSLARNHGVSLTAKSNNTRYDARSRVGKEANAAIEHAAHQANWIQPQISEVRGTVWRNIAGWRSSFDVWASSRSALPASGVFIAVASWALFISDAGAGRGWLQALVFGPMQYAPSAAVNAIVLGELAYLATFLLAKRRLNNTLPDREGAPAWLFLTSKWNPAIPVDERYFPHNAPQQEAPQSKSSRTKSGSSKRHRATAAPVEHVAEWPEVLGVPRDATPADIKSAYRTAMKAYHSDLVATLGPKLRQVAEDESKRINLAYEQACKDRSFAK